VSRAFNQRLKKLVDNCPWVNFAQTYPQQALVPRHSVEAPPEAEPEHAAVLMPDRPRSQ
jgi:hypothetical protein